MERNDQERASSDTQRDTVPKKSSGDRSFPKLPKDSYSVLGKHILNRLNTWRALVMKGRHRTPAEDNRLLDTFFDGLTVKTYLKDTPKHSTSSSSKQRCNDGDDSNPSLCKIR